MELIPDVVEQGNSNQFAKVDDMKIESPYAYHFGDTDFALTDFEKINKYAYFDYQRNKVFLKTEPSIKKAVKKVCKRRTNKIDKIIQLWPDRCPKCNNNKLINSYKSKRRIADLKFMANGVKKWNIEIRGGKFQCNRCGHVFVPKEFQAHKLTDKHGHNLMSWAMNQHITYRIGISNLPDMIRELFHINLSYWAVYGFKERLAKEYANTLEEIKQNIIRGTLLHADETQVKKIAEYKTGYVWVFTNMDSVFYLLKPTREADFLKDLLDGFHGVLVSDYYPGYDSLPCPQQKCLVHLIRDLNDDLLHHQLDTEYKHVVKNFGALLRKIMETVNTYGLKKRHLHKHQRDVKRFYRQVLNCDYESELVAKYQKRLNKYREKLFTFLNYDGIPWNNNNAEHAIKPFAKYRDSITGKFSVQGLENYLTLLSIQQTCVYRGVRFLDFLKSGERSIEEYCRKN